MYVQSTLLSTCYRRCSVCWRIWRPNPQNHRWDQQATACNHWNYLLWYWKFPMMHIQHPVKFWSVVHTQSRVLQADWLILENSEKTTLNIKHDLLNLEISIDHSWNRVYLVDWCRQFQLEMCERLQFCYSLQDENIPGF